MYSLLKKILFRLDPEKAHTLALKSLQVAHRLKLTNFISPLPSKPNYLMGMHFPNPIGLAAGLDKNGDYIDALAALGFGFIEIGTVTPEPQTGNIKPRLFRLEKQEAIINRMGFNNNGANYVLSRLQKVKYKGVLGINIGKNSFTPLENAVEDYLKCFNKLAPYASYITINISSPNTQGLRDLQQSNFLTNLLQNLKAAQTSFLERYKKYVPLVVKIAPDLTREEIAELAESLLDSKIDGVIATNTTTSRNGVVTNESGGLSGKPLTAKATDVVCQLSLLLENKIPIIASGGIMSANDVRDKINAGASLVQLYSGLIYRGPRLVRECCE